VEKDTRKVVLQEICNGGIKDTRKVVLKEICKGFLF
jgi:hypothetical protein